MSAHAAPRLIAALRAPLFGLWLIGTMACVPRDAGYRETRNLIAERIGYAPRWGAVDDRGDVEDATRRILAKPLTADGAVRVALLRSAELQAAFEELGVARADLVEALRLPNPTAEGHLHLVSASDVLEVELVATIDIIRLVFMPLRKSAGDAELEAAKARVAGLVLDHAFAVKGAFYDWQAEVQMLELRRTVLAAVRASLAATEEIHEAGNAPDFELLSEQAMYEDARFALARTETAVVTRRQRLAMLMGLWGKRASFEAAERLPDPPDKELALADLERRALARSLDLAEAKSSYEAAARRSDLAQAEGIVPELKVGAGAEREQEGWEIGPQVELEVPLFYQGQGAVARADAEMRRSAERHKALAVRIRAAARSAAARLEAARATVAHYRDVLLPLRERVVQEAQRQSNAMNLGVSQLLVARREQIETGVGYVEARRDYWLARAEVELLRAGRVPGPRDAME